MAASAIPALDLDLEFRKPGMTTMSGDRITLSQRIPLPISIAYTGNNGAVTRRVAHKGRSLKSGIINRLLDV